MEAVLAVSSICLLRAFRIAGDGHDLWPIVVVSTFTTCADVYTINIYKAQSVQFHIAIYVE